MLTPHSLWKNIASLGVLQVFNFALTLATLPYLTRTLGVAGWGSIVFVQLVINYLSWGANWGFYLGATKKISAERANKEKQSRIFMATWIAQWYLTGGLLAVLLLGAMALPMLRQNGDLYFAASGILIGNVLMPLWYLNGLEKIRESALIQMAVKLFALPCIFIFVKEPADKVLYLWINSVSSIFVGLVVLLWISRSKFVDFVLPTAIEIRVAIVDDFHLFSSAMWANLNSLVIPTTLGIFGGAAELGYYNLADRARSAAITILNPITHALFPRMCYLFSNERERAIHLLKYSGGAMLLLSLMMCGFIMYFSTEIIAALGGGDFQSGSLALSLLAFSPVFTTISAFIIHQILVPMGAFKIYVRAMFYTLVVNLLLVYPAVTGYGSIGGAAVSLATEFFTVVLLVLYIRAQKLLGSVSNVAEPENAIMETK